MKYFAIRYTEDFTKDIYDHLIKWCDKNIISDTCKWYEYFPDNTYKRFQKPEGQPGVFRYIQTNVGVDNNFQNSPEITLTELCEMIGYTKKMTKEELLEEAKKRYPVGTVFKCLHGCKGGPIKEEDHKLSGDPHDGCIRVLNGCGCIYDRGKWAEIISKPEEKVTPEFEVGKWYVDRKGWAKPWYIKLIKYSKERVDGECVSESGAYSKNYYWTNQTMIENLELLTDLSEIQQYLPKGHVDKFPVKQNEMKELTELPERWCVTVTNDIYHSVNEFYQNHLDEYEDCKGTYDVTVGVTFYYPQHAKGVHSRKGGSIDTRYSEITPEQFKKWALKENVSDVPEYYECIKPDKWVQTIKMNNGNLIFHKDFISYSKNPIYQDYLSARGAFKPSTKEAYDAQFKKKETIKDDYQNLLDLEIGDTVKCISKDESKFMSSSAGAGWKADHEFVITKIDKYSRYNIYFGGVNDNGVYSDTVRLVKKKSSVEPWSAGTYVVFTSEVKCSNKVKKGDVCMIEEDKGDYVQVQNYLSLSKNDPEDDVKWFATKAEAEKFAEQFKATPMVNTIEPKVVESNLEKANRRFKVGTKGKTIYNTPFTITESSLPFIDRGYDIIDANGLWVLYDKHLDKWAAIESTPQENWCDDAILNFQVECTSQLDVFEYKIGIDDQLSSIESKDSDLIAINFEIPIVIGE